MAYLTHSGDPFIPDEPPETFTEADLSEILDLDKYGDIPVPLKKTCCAPKETQRVALSPGISDTCHNQVDLDPEPLALAHDSSFNLSPELMEDLLESMESPLNDPRDKQLEIKQHSEFSRELPSLFQLEKRTHVIPLNTAPSSYETQRSIDRYESTDRYMQEPCPFHASRIETSRTQGFFRSPRSSFSSAFNEVDPLMGQTKLAVVSDHEPKTFYDECNASADIDDFWFEREYTDEKVSSLDRNFQTEKQVFYIEPTNIDVLLGRGARTNLHPGNDKYHQEKLKIQPKYKAARKDEKTSISQELVDIVHAYGGRFLQLDKETGKWFEVDNCKARKKASQALREENTPEKRAQKRMMYPARSQAKRQKC